MENKRLQYLDIAKGIGIFLVLWGHLLPDGFLDDFIYAFHMPLFFFLSGFLLCKKRKETKKDWKMKLFYQLIVPYLCFSFFYLLWELVVIKETAIGMIYLAWQTVTFRGMAPLWYLASLYFAEIVFLPVANRSIGGAIVLVLIMGIFNTSIGPHIDLSVFNGFISNPLQFLVRTSLCLFFVGGGYFFCMIWERFVEKRFCRTAAFSAAGLMLGICAAFTVMFDLEINLHLYAINNFPLFIVTGLIGACGVLLLSVSISENPVLEAWGQQFLLLMALHYPITQLISPYIKKAPWPAVQLAAISLLLTLVLLWILNPLCKRLSKFAPVLAGKGRKRRCS